MLPTQPLLRTLVGLAEPQPIAQADVPALANWLIRHELGPLAHHLYRTAWPALAKALQGDAFTAMAENAILLTELQRTLAALNGAGVANGLLKGAAVAHTAYPQPYMRLMADVDVWVQTEDLTAAMSALQEAGFIWASPIYKLTKYGKAELIVRDWVKGSVDLQDDTFPGYWLRYTGRGDKTAVWNRQRPLTVQGQATHTLAAEDALLHAAIHLAINHQFDDTALRNMVDMMRLAHVVGADWGVVAERARAWRVSTVWQFVAGLMAQLWGEDALPHTPLSAWRARLLGRFITPAHLLNQNRLKYGPKRFLLLLALVDGP